MTYEPGYYKKLLESLLEADTTPLWVRNIIPTDDGPIAVFNNLNYPIMLEDDEIIHVRRVEFYVLSGVIRVYISRQDVELVLHDQNPKECDNELKTFFEKLFAPYELDDVHRSRVYDFIQYDALDAYMRYGSYYLSGQVGDAWEKYIYSMDNETQLAAVKSNPDYIRYIDDPDESLQMMVVQKDPYNIQYIAHPTDAVQLAAIKNAPDTTTYIENPTVLSQPSAKYYIMKFLIDRRFDKADYHVTSIIEYLRNHGINWPDLVHIERSLNAHAKKITETVKLSDLNTASEKRQLSAIKNDWRKIKYIENPSLAVQLAAVQNYGGAIYYILHKNIVPSEEVQLAAVQQDGWVINDLINKGIVPSEAVQLAALRQNVRGIRSITNPSPAIFADMQVKQSVIKNIMDNIVNSSSLGLQVAADTVKYLRKHGVQWPDLVHIERSLNNSSK